MSQIENSLYLADCIDLLRDWYSKGQTNFIDLIYIDPPFNSNRNYNVLIESKLTEEAFQDKWSSVSYLDELEGIATMNPNLYNFLKMLETTGLPKSYISYLVNMSLRCWYMKEMLKDTGSFYYHCDPTMSHYVKIMLDYIFGRGNFRNEIIWGYTSGGASKSHFSKKHDIIFLYSKTNNYKFNSQLYKRFVDKSKGYDPRIKYLKDEETGKEYRLNIMTDCWNDIGIISPNSFERLGYPTQKSEKLLERIILASSNEGDLIADFFMGAGTTIAVAERLNRKWIGSDINHRALQITQSRIENLHKVLKRDFFIYGIPRSSEMSPTKLKGQDFDMA